MTSATRLQKAEQVAFSKLLFAPEEAERLEQELERALKSGQLSLVLWAVVRFLGPSAEKHPLKKWEPAFATPQKGGVLGEFVASFNDYVREDVPINMKRQDFQAMMRDTPHEGDFPQYCKYVNYLKQIKAAWGITSQRVHAWKDPRKIAAGPWAFLAPVASFFGERVEYTLVEYCLVLDVQETFLQRPRRRHIHSERTASADLRRLLATGPLPETHGDDAASSSSSSSSPEDTSVPRLNASATETTEDVTAVVVAAAAEKSGSKLLLSSSTSNSKGGLTRILAKSLSLSSSGKRDQKKKKK
jgi:hypothetical protein